MLCISGVGYGATCVPIVACLLWRPVVGGEALKALDETVPAFCKRKIVATGQEVLM